MGYIETHGGNRFKCRYLTTLPEMGIMFLIVEEVSIEEATELFNNAYEMSIIKHCGETFSGYTHVDMITDMGYGIKAQMSIPR